MRIVFSFLLAFTVTAAQAQSPQAVAAYVERYKDIAIEEMKTYGIPASVTLAQGIHESGCGCSVLALKSNNHFGIKCHEEWSGQTYHHDDDAPQECFRVYNCPEESFRDHSAFLKNRPRYATLFLLDAGDYKAWAKGLKAAGYATNPKYPEIIIKLVEDYNLTQYDKPGGKNNKAEVTAAITKKDKKEIDFIKQSLMEATTIPAPTASATPVTTEPIARNIDFSKYTSDERVVNGLKAVIYRKEVPIALLAQHYNVTVEQLYTFNDLKPAEKIKDNDLIFLQHKKPESNYYQYEVSDGETMRDIAQKFGVQLAALIQRNGIMANCEPVKGEMIVLRGKREMPLKFKVVGNTALDKVPPNGDKMHTVATSETLYSISRQYNIPVDTLRRINGLRDEDNIKIGQTLIVDL